jgi:hypothetical protein
MKPHEGVGELVKLHTKTILTMGKHSHIPVEKETGQLPKLVWTLWISEKSLSHIMNQSLSHLAHHLQSIVTELPNAATYTIKLQ